VVGGITRYLAGMMPGALIACRGPGGSAPGIVLAMY